MYQQHFGLTARPFSIAPDPRFLFMSQRHREALAHLLYGVGESGGFVQLTGEVGTGKTTISRCLLEQLPENVDVAMILNPRVSGLELIASICEELQVEYPHESDTTKPLIDALNNYLLDAHANGRHTVVIIDEAQNLDTEVLEQVRLLTNLETTQEKLLQVILIGQPELRDLLAQEDLRQLSQRITARYHLEPIAAEDTVAYIRHRLDVCGASGDIFTGKAIKLIQRFSKGVPRIINILCDRSLLGAYVEGKRQVTDRIVRRAAAEVLPGEPVRTSHYRVWWVTALLLLTAVPLAIWQGSNILARLQNVQHSQSGSPSSDVLANKPALMDGNPPQIVEAKILNDSDPVNSLPAPVIKIPETIGKTLEQLLADADPSAAGNAWPSLYRQWGYKSEATAEEQACSEASRVGLQCLRRSGSWAAVLQFNRPLLLMMAAPDGRRLPMLVEAVDGDQVSVEIDENTIQLPLSEIERFWFGKFRLLWRTPPGGQTSLRPGARHSDVRWLKEQLQAVMGVDFVGSSTDFFNWRLKKLLQEFQIEHGLTADGIAGPETFIYLNSVNGGPDIPRLVDKQSAQPETELASES